MEGRRVDKARYFDIAVLGGGAAGIAAAISAGRQGRSVVVCERLPRLGRKILASGNGRCNLLNEDLSESFYNPQARPLVKSIFSKFGKSAIIELFEGLGLRTYSEEKRIFPVTNQSSSVLAVLEIELKRIPVHIEPGFEVTNVTCDKNGFLLPAKSGLKISCSALIIAAGGRSYPALGSDGSCYDIIRRLGHKVIEPVPSAVPVVAKDPACHLLQGQKISASAKVVIDAKVAAQAAGEALFTKYGLSGTAILDISREISIALNRLRKKDVKVILDMVPFMNEAALRSELEKRAKSRLPPEEFLTGIVPNKFGTAFKDLFRTKDPASIAKCLKAKEFIITGTRGWNEADFTAGGIDVQEVVPGTLESKMKKGLYFAGEILDVDGCRGGYNLAWAWASGHVAGQSAAAREI